MITNDLIQIYLQSKQLSGVPLIDYVLQNDGYGVFIAKWDENKLGVQPTESDLQPFILSTNKQQKILEVDNLYLKKRASFTLNGVLLLYNANDAKDLIDKFIKENTLPQEKQILFPRKFIAQNTVLKIVNEQQAQLISDSLWFAVANLYNQAQDLKTLIQDAKTQTALTKIKLVLNDISITL
jgi:hypothetical protein